jgi:hypothetical protein
MKGYSMLNTKYEKIPMKVSRYGHIYKLAGTISSDGSFAGATRNKAQAQSTVDVYHNMISKNGGWKAIIVPYIAKATYHWHEKGEKFYIVYIREYEVK